jgi:ABC-2 type transport system permease protein
LVGADGVGSTVREQLGIGFNGVDYSEHFLLADVPWDTAPWSNDRSHGFLQEEGLLLALPALLLVALMLSALGLLLSNGIRQLENFAGVMNFVIFPLFFLSSALYPLWKMRDASQWLYWLCAVNPFTHAVELVRFALYERLAGLALAICLGLTVLFTLLAVLTFNPQHAALRKPG